LFLSGHFVPLITARGSTIKEFSRAGGQYADGINERCDLIVDENGVGEGALVLSLYQEDGGTNSD